jgi:hypothetical protein
MRLVVLVGLDPVHAVGIGAVQHVGGADGFHFLRAAGVHDRRRHAGADHHRDEAGIDAVAVRQAEGDVGQAAGGVDLELVAQAAQQREDLLAGGAHGADRHDQRVDNDVMRLDAVIGGVLDDLLGNGEAHVRVFGNAGFIVGDRDHRHVVFLAQRQDGLELLLSPVTELTSGRPLATFSAASMAAVTELSMDSGTSTSS